MRENLVELGDLVARRGHPPPATARIAEDGIREKDGSLVSTERWHEYIVSNVGWAASSYPQKLGVTMAEMRRTFINLVLEYAEVNQLQCALTEENSESEGEEEAAAAALAMDVAFKVGPSNALPMVLRRLRFLAGRASVRLSAGTKAGRVAFGMTKGDGTWPPQR